MWRRIDPHVERHGGRAFLTVPMTRSYIWAMEWEGFLVIKDVCEREGIDPDKLVWRYTEENYIDVVAVFEIGGASWHPDCRVPGPHGPHTVLCHSLDVTFNGPHEVFWQENCGGIPDVRG